MVAGTAAAQAALVAASPEPGQQLAESPPEIRLTFSEPIAANSQVAVYDAGGDSIPDLVPQFNVNQPNVLYVPLPPLEPGLYTVVWATVTEDGQPFDGRYSFSTGLVTPTPIPPEPAALPGQQSGGVVWLLLLVAALAVGLPLGLLVWRRAQSRLD